MRVTLNGLKRVDMKVNARWIGKQVYIYSREHGAYWRHGGCGYTCKDNEAGQWDFLAAVAETRHCGPEKKIEYVAIPEAALKTAQGKQE